MHWVVFTVLGPGYVAAAAAAAADLMYLCLFCVDHVWPCQPSSPEVLKLFLRPCTSLCFPVCRFCEGCVVCHVYRAVVGVSRRPCGELIAWTSWSI